MRVLAVIGSELIGGSARNDWVVLNALLAANGPTSTDVRVMALVNGPGHDITVGNPLGRALARMPRWNFVPSEAYSPSESARGRLDRAVLRLRALGVRASGDIEPGDAYRAVRREVAQGGYTRVLILERDDSSWARRVAGASLTARLRRTLDIPVDAPGRQELAPPR